MAADVEAGEREANEQEEAVSSSYNALYDDEVVLQDTPPSF